ncbi:MAG: HEAT repeat domain-containing protein, partial [Alphaproteobacteria bacterium]
VDARLAAAIVETLAAATRSEQRAAADAIAPQLDALPVLADALRAALDDPRQRLRWGVAYVLGRASASSPRRLWPAVREAMALPDGDQRWAAAELATTLARQDAAVADAVTEATGDATPVLRRMALYALRDLAGAGLGETARRALGDPDATVRLAALAALVAAPDDPESREAGARLAAARVADDPDPGVRRAAAATLGRLGVAVPEVAAVLDGAAKASDASLARAAREAIRRLAGKSPER